jgi:dTDP-4-dehydrorhamnose 3,5-epimerase
MKFSKTALPGVVAIELEPQRDGRGLFARFWCKDEFANASLPTEFVQGSISRNSLRGTLRGMHLQLGPTPEAKLVRCVRGHVHDVILDLRKDSPTYRQWTALELDAESGRAVLIPAGCAHGFLTLEDDSELLYLMTAPYDPRYQMGVRWNDPAFDIVWPFEPGIIAERDCSFPDYAGD